MRAPRRSPSGAGELGQHAAGEPPARPARWRRTPGSPARRQTARSAATAAATSESGAPQRSRVVTRTAIGPGSARPAALSMLQEPSKLSLKARTARTDSSGTRTPASGWKTNGPAGGRTNSSSLAIERSVSVASASTPRRATRKMRERVTPCWSAGCAGTFSARARRWTPRRRLPWKARCPSCPRSRRSAASSRRTSRGARSTRSRSSTRAGARRWPPHEHRRRGRRAARVERARAARQVPRSSSSPARSSCSCHLRMTGTLLLDPRPTRRYQRVVFDLDDGHELRFCDPRRFGTGELALGDGRRCERVLRRAARHRAAGRRRSTGARAARAGPRAAARRSRRSCSTSARSPASATSTPTRRCSARASTRCARRGRSRARSATALADAVRDALSAGHRRRRRDDRRLPPPRRRLRRASRTSSSSTCARASRARAAARTIVKLVAAGAGPTSASAASPGRGSGGGLEQLGQPARRGRPPASPGSRRRARRR